MDFKDTTKEAEFRKKCHDWLDANAQKKTHRKLFRELTTKQSI